MIHDESDKTVGSFRYLGIVFDCGLQWELKTDLLRLLEKNKVKIIACFMFGIF